MNQPYTVLLLRPDYGTNNYGQDTYLDWIEAADPKEAMSQAQRNACVLDGEDCADDYFVLACFEGTHQDISGCTNR